MRRTPPPPYWRSRRRFSRAMEISGAPRIIHIDETGSTNADAMRLAVNGEDLPLWVIADRQTAGRGRQGRTWVSPKGNLYASLAFCCPAPIERAGQLSLVAGISLFEAIRTSTDLAQDAGLRLKWPNDVLIGAAKMGGILVESTSARGSPGFLAVIGFGVNVVSAPDDLDRQATALGRHGNAPSPNALLMALSDQVSRWLEVWDGSENFPDIRRAWIERAGSIGEPITVNSVDGRISGRYQGLSETGALLAEVNGQIREISHGDVALGSVAADDGDI